MKASDFLNSRWMQMARDKGAEKKVRKEFHKWLEKAKDTERARRGTQLWDYFASGKATGTDKLIVIAALLYLISPVDLVPEAVMPVAGLLDDLGVATMALEYVLKKIDRKKAGKGKGGKKGKRGDRVGAVLKAVKKALS